MSNISVRLPEEVLRQLQYEADRTHRKRSEIIREAVLDYLKQSERERFLQQMVAEAKAGYANPDIRREALQIDVEFSAVEDDQYDGQTQWWK